MYGGDEVKTGEDVQFLEVFPNALANEFANLSGIHLDQDTKVYRTPDVIIHGLHYKRNEGSVVLLYQDDVPEFAYITDIIVHDRDKYFVLLCMDTVFGNFSRMWNILIFLH